MAYAEIDPTSRDIAVATQWVEKELIKLIPGVRWDSRAKTWRLPLAWASCVALRGVFKDGLQIGDELITWAHKYREHRVDPTLSIRNDIELDYGALVDDDERLYSFQRAGIQFIVNAWDVLLGDEMGTGKTVQTLVAMRQIPDALPALIICPNSVKRSWERHVRDWFPTATPYVVGNTAAKRRDSIKLAKDDPNAIVIINIEATRLVSRLAPFGSTKLKRCKECDPKFGDDIRTSQCEVHQKELNDFGFRTVVFDEAHRMKEAKTAQTRAAWYLMHAPDVRRRLGLTGTPLAQHPGDLWAIMHGIAPYDFPAKSKYIDRYCMSSWNEFGGLDVVGVHPDHKVELFSILDPHFRRVTKAEVLPQLPNKVREVREVEMTPSQRRMYNDLEKKLQTRTDSGQLLLTPNHLEKATRLTQLASSTVEIDKGDEDDLRSWKVYLKNPSPKIDELENIMRDLGDTPFVVAAESKKLINLAAERMEKLKVRHALITGDVSEYERDRALDMLNKNQIRVLLFTCKAGGTGLNMSAVDTLVNLQRSWSLVDVVQTEDRVHRIGSERHQKVRIIDVVTKDTIEEDQIERIHMKLERLEEITRDRARLRERGEATAQLDEEEAKIMSSFVGVPDDSTE